MAPLLVRVRIATSPSRCRSTATVEPGHGDGAAARGPYGPVESLAPGDSLATGGAHQPVSDADAPGVADALGDPDGAGPADAAAADTLGLAEAAGVPDEPGPADAAAVLQGLKDGTESVGSADGVAPTIWSSTA